LARPTRPRLARPNPVQPRLAQPNPARPKLAQPNPARPKLAQPDPARPRLAQPKPPPGARHRPPRKQAPLPKPLRVLLEARRRQARRRQARRRVRAQQPGNPSPTRRRAKKAQAKAALLPRRDPAPPPLQWPVRTRRPGASHHQREQRTPRPASGRDSSFRGSAKKLRRRPRRKSS